MKDYAELIQKVIYVDANNDTAPAKIPQTNNTTTAAAKNAVTALNWTGAGGIVCP